VTDEKGTFDVQKPGGGEVDLENYTEPIEEGISDRREVVEVRIVRSRALQVQLVLLERSNLPLETTILGPYTVGCSLRPAPQRTPQRARVCVARGDR
jgi:hypothetical protein